MAELKTLLDVDYITRDERAVIRLFYKDEKDRNIVEITDFQPYFYAIPENSDALIEDLKRFSNIVKVDRKNMLDLKSEIGVIRIYTKQPKDVPKLREEISGLKSCREVREADIPFTKRYLIDSGLVPMENCEDLNLKIAAIDIEVYNSSGEPKSDKDPIIMISYADSLGLKRVLTYKTNPELHLEFVEILNNEAEMIKRLTQIVRNQKIDIITSYNGDNFDFPYLNERSEKLKIDLKLGIDESEVKLERRGMNLGADIKGRPHVDMFPIARQIFHISRYRLEDVYSEIFDEEKFLIKSDEISRFWDSENREEFEKLLKYSLSDVESTLKIALALLPLQYELSRIIRQPMYEVSRMGSGQKVESLLIERAFKKNILVPNKPPEDITEERLDETYVGAYVVEPVNGIHDNIALFDFRSLYPSIIISHNIDPSTIDCDCCRDNGFMAPSGHYFCKNKRGFIPEILEELVNKRIKVKEKLKSEKDPKKKKLLDVQQQALKILANSMYGYYGFSRARWYSKDCAESITALGREYIHKTIKVAESEGFKVVYGDTDSVYITYSQELSREKILEKAMVFSDKINKELPEAMELEFSGFYPRGIFITKKRYALMDEKDKLTVKGLETRRRDWAEIARRTQEDVLNAILKEKDPEKAADIVKERVQRIKSGKVSLMELGINTQITRSLKDYVQDGPHVVAAKKAVKLGREFKQGEIITYVVTKKGDSISDRSQLIEYVAEGDYDPDYYINNQLLPAVLRILEALGYSEDELKGLGKQLTLGEW